NRLSAFLQMGFHRLAVDHPVELRIAVAAVIALGAAYEILVELLVGIVEAVLADDCADREILAHYLRVPVSRVDRVELAVDIDLLQMIDQDDRRVAGRLDIADRELEGQ